MRAVVQRAEGAAVTVAGRQVGGFEGPGLVVLVGVTHEDTTTRAKRLADKVFDLRIFDARHAVAPHATRELSASELGLPVVVISQFTLYADTRGGRRPTWDAAAPRHVAEPLVAAVAERLAERGAAVTTGEFGADMRVSLTNDGPMTIVLDITD